MEISQLELKNQAATQTLFTFPTGALSGHTVGTSLLIFLAMTKSSTCPFRSLCGPNRTEYQVSNNSNTQPSYLPSKTSAAFWDIITYQSTVLKCFRD